MQKDEENESFSHHEVHMFHNPTGRHTANSTELLGHDNVHTMMSKVKHRIAFTEGVKQGSQRQAHPNHIHMWKRRVPVLLRALS